MSRRTCVRHRIPRHARSIAASARGAGRTGGRPSRSASTRTCSSTASSCSTRRQFTALAETVASRHRSVSPETEVRLHRARFRATRGTSRRSTARCTTSRAAYPFDPEREDYLVHITTGTHVAQICLFLLTESRYLPGALLQTSPRRGTRAQRAPGAYTIIDLDLSRYDRIATRFAARAARERVVPQVAASTRATPPSTADRARSSRSRCARARRCC